MALRSIWKTNITNFIQKREKKEGGTWWYVFTPVITWFFTATAILLSGLRVLHSAAALLHAVHLCHLQQLDVTGSSQQPVEVSPISTKQHIPLLLPRCLPHPFHIPAPVPLLQPSSPSRQAQHLPAAHWVLAQAPCSSNPNNCTMFEHSKEKKCTGLSASFCWKWCTEYDQCATRCPVPSHVHKARKGGDHQNLWSQSTLPHPAQA